MRNQKFHPFLDVCEFPQTTEYLRDWFEMAPTRPNLQLWPTFMSSRRTEQRSLRTY